MPHCCVFFKYDSQKSLDCSFSLLCRITVSEGAKECSYMKYRKMFCSSIAFNIEFMHNRACNLIMFCLTEDTINQTEIMSSVYCYTFKLVLYLLYLRVYASNAHPKHISSFMYFLFPFDSLPPPPSNPPVFFSSSSANPHPFAFFAVICLLWHQPKWVMSWEISTSPVFPGIFFWLFSSLAFSTVSVLKFMQCFELPFDSEGWNLKTYLQRDKSGQNGVGV